MAREPNEPQNIHIQTFKNPRDVHDTNRRVEVILDGGARVSIMAKLCREKWGRPPMEKLSLIFKLANGMTMKPVGVVNDLQIKTFGITCHIWFVAMDFKNPINSYDIILERPFLRSAQIVHDWSNNTTYLKKDAQAVKVDLTAWKPCQLRDNLFVVKFKITTRKF